MQFLSPGEQLSALLVKQLNNCNLQGVTAMICNRFSPDLLSLSAKVEKHYWHKKKVEKHNWQEPAN